MSTVFSAHQRAAEFADFAHELGDLAQRQFEGVEAGFTFELKDDQSPVTEFDRAVEEELTEYIRHRYPGHGVLGEELPPHQTDNEFVWVMDPIDGTKQFIAGVPVYTTLISLCWQQRPVLGLINAPRTEERWFGMEGAVSTKNGAPITTSGRSSLLGASVAWSNPEVLLPEHRAGADELRSQTAWRVFGAAAYGIGKVASGELDIAVESGTIGPHDVCALAPIIGGAGGSTSDGFGNPVTMHTDGTFVAAASERLRAHVVRVLNVDTLVAPNLSD